MASAAFRALVEEFKVCPVDRGRLVSKTDPFPNGNGRHARMITDVVAVKSSRPLKGLSETVISEWR